MWIVRCHKDTDGQRSENIEEQNTPEDSADCLGDVLAWVLGFASCDSNKLNTTIRESCIHQDGEQTQESTGVSGRIILFHGAWMLPVAETQTIVLWSTTEVNNECHDQQTNDGNDLYTGKNELRFTIDLNGEDIQADHDDDNDRDPYCNIDVLCA